MVGMPKHGIESIEVMMPSSEVQEVVTAAYQRGFQDGVLHSAVLFKKLFRRIQNARTIGELQTIVKELDDIGSPVAESGKNRRKSRKSPKEGDGR